MTKTTESKDDVLIVLVEDNSHHRNRMKQFLTESFPNCKVKTISHGIEAMNYLLTPVNVYHLVILDGNLNHFPQPLLASVNGPDIAAAMREKNIEVPVVLWTSDPSMLARFDEVYGERLPEIEKPCRKTNIQAVLTPIMEEIASGLKHNSSPFPDSITNTL